MTLKSNQTKQIITESYSNINTRLKELKASPTIDTFRADIKVFWKLKFKTGYTADFTVNNASGDLINLSGGSWILAGTCSGYNYSSKPFTTNFSIEFNNLTKSIIWVVGELTLNCIDVLNPNSAVQLRIDISGNPQLILVRVDTLFGVPGDLYRILTGSYTSLS